MSRYRISESVQGNRFHPIHRYEDLGIHHPTANALGMKTGRPEDFQHGRPHQQVEGRFEEIRQLADGRTLIKKDFILSHDGQGPTRIPSPASGYVHYRNDHYATVDIFDKPFGQAGAKLLAQVLHMDASTFALKEGAEIAYGQPLGVMSHTGLPNGVHAHIEAEPAQFHRYIQDLNNGVITPEKYPESERSFSEAVQLSTASRQDFERQDSLHDGVRTFNVTRLQEELKQLGYQDSKGHSLLSDGTLGPNTTHAIKSFQRAHHLHVDGIVGKHTLAALEDAKRWPLLSEATHPQHRLYGQVEQGIRHLQRANIGGRELENAAVALTISAHARGLANIDHVVLGADGVNLFAVQGRLDDPGHRRVHVELSHAMAHAIDHRAVTFQQPDFAHVVPAPQHQPAQRGPVMLGP